MCAVRASPTREVKVCRGTEVLPAFEVLTLVAAGGEYVDKFELQAQQGGLLLGKQAAKQKRKSEAGARPDVVSAQVLPLCDSPYRGTSLIRNRPPP